MFDHLYLQSKKDFLFFFFFTFLVDRLSCCARIVFSELDCRARILTAMSFLLGFFLGFLIAFQSVTFSWAWLRFRGLPYPHPTQHTYEQQEKLIWLASWMYQAPCSILPLSVYQQLLLQCGLFCWGWTLLRGHVRLFDCVTVCFTVWTRQEYITHQKFSVFSPFLVQFSRLSSSSPTNNKKDGRVNTKKTHHVGSDSGYCVCETCTFLWQCQGVFQSKQAIQISEAADQRPYHLRSGCDANPNSIDSYQHP